MRKPSTLEIRTAIRAYYMALNNQGASDLDRWFSAETIEKALAAKRSASARKGVETKAARLQAGLTGKRFAATPAISASAH